MSRTEEEPEPQLVRMSNVLVAVAVAVAVPVTHERAARIKKTCLSMRLASGD